jgi:TetR/AcrR family transcriptional regulator, transcriptional repressor for nem operon
MRYAKGRKEETRRRVIAAASRRFRRDGIDATGLAGVMADAGLTHGGFYAHFASKDELVRAALAASLAATRDRLAAEAKRAREEGADGLEAIVRTYLGAAHRDRPEAGCAMAALAAEIARQDAPTRDVAADAIWQIVSIIAAELPADASDQTSRQTAYAIFSVMVGTLQLARVTGDPALSEVLLRSGREAALTIAGRGLRAGRT